jgi:hypothetical protein
VLFGAEFNAELERGRALATAPANREPLVELRDRRKLRKRTGGKPHAWRVPASGVEVELARASLDTS